MTLSALGVTAVYLGLGSTGPFLLADDNGNPILFENDSEIVVTTYTDPSGEYTAGVTLTQGLDYTLTGAGSSTPGSVTLTAPLPLDDFIVIRRRTPKTQELDLKFGGDLSLEDLEQQLDKQTRITQELGEQTERSMLFSATEVDLVSSRSRVVPRPVPNTALVWNAGLQLENRALNTLGATGPAGPKGPAGKIPGPKGDDGDEGPQGPIGRRGPSGSAGVTGSKGRTGSRGIEGDQGDDGSAGPQGRRGPTGSAGAQGARGKQGIPGLEGEIGDTGDWGPQGRRGLPGGAGVRGPRGYIGFTGVDGEDGDRGPPGRRGATGPAGGGSANTGTAQLDFGAFPGKSDTSVAITGQAGILSGSIVNVGIRPVASADHSADEHMLEPLKVLGGNIIAGTGFTAYGINTSQLNEPVVSPVGLPGGGGLAGGNGTRLYGLFNVWWEWK